MIFNKKPATHGLAVYPSVQVDAHSMHICRAMIRIRHRTLFPTLVALPASISDGVEDHHPLQRRIYLLLVECRFKDKSSVVLVLSLELQL